MLDFGHWLFQLISQHGIISVIFAGLIEQVIVPIPSPIVPMAAGFLFVSKENFGFFNLIKEIFWRAALPFSIGSTLGSTIIYLGTWWGGKWLIERFKKWLGFGWEEIEALKNKYFRGGWLDEIVIFLFRAIPVVPSVLISAVCGAVRIKPRVFYLFTWLGLLVRGMLLGWLGWQSGETLFQVSNSLDRWEMILSLLMVAFGGGLLLWGYFRREKWLASLKEKK